MLSGAFPCVVCMFSGFLLQSKDRHGVILNRLCLCVISAKDWHCDRLQPPSNPEMHKWRKTDGLNLWRLEKPFINIVTLCKCSPSLFWRLHCEQSLKVNFKEPRTPVFFVKFCDNCQGTFREQSQEFLQGVDPYITWESFFSGKAVDWPPFATSYKTLYTNVTNAITSYLGQRQLLTVM